MCLCWTGRPTSSSAAYSRLAKSSRGTYTARPGCGPGTAEGSRPGAAQARAVRMDQMSGKDGWGRSSGRARPEALLKERSFALKREHTREGKVADQSCLPRRNKGRGGVRRRARMARLLDLAALSTRGRRICPRAGRRGHAKRQGNGAQGEHQDLFHGLLTSAGCSGGALEPRSSPVEGSASAAVIPLNPLPGVRTSSLWFAGNAPPLTPGPASPASDRSRRG